MFDAAVYLSGDSFPRDAYVEAALRCRLAGAFDRWVGQADLLAEAGETEFQPGIRRRLALLDGRVTQRTILIGRSSGARVATLFSMRKPVAGVVCIAYPFRPLHGTADPGRFAHLTEIAVPTLILQGTDDQYGGVNIVRDYALSASVVTQFIGCDHAFRLSAADWDSIGERILAFCAQAYRDS